MRTRSDSTSWREHQSTAAAATAGDGRGIAQSERGKPDGEGIKTRRKRTNPIWKTEGAERATGAGRDPAAVGTRDAGDVPMAEVATVNALIS